MESKLSFAISNIIGIKIDSKIFKNNLKMKQLCKNKKLYSFNPNYRIVAKIKGHWSIEDISKEQGMFGATEEFARRHGGKITQTFLDAIPNTFRDDLKKAGLYTNIDVRIHRLYPGMFPAIPGWHCDGVYRETYFSQPDLDRVFVSHHLSTTISSEKEGVSNTRFLNIPIEIDIDGCNQEVGVWQRVHEYINTIPKENLSCWDSKDGQLVQFDNHSLHKSTPCVRHGWRMFLRVSGLHKPNLTEGQLSKQEQVYVISEEKGW